MPESDYPAICKAAEQRFPNWGYYNTSKDTAENLAESELVAGGAIDDKMDIINDLKRVMRARE